MSAQTFPVSYDLDGAESASGVSRREIQRAIATGDLTAHYVGAKFTKPLILRDDLHAWVESLPTTRRAS